MTGIPHDRLPDSSLMLVRDGYQFIPKRVRKYKSDIFSTRLMLRRAICVSGTEAAEMFYQPDRFTRIGALPPHTVRLLTDKGSVQMLDGEEHRHRKAMFMNMMTPESIASLLDLADTAWQEQIPVWAKQGRVVLLDEVERLLCRVVIRWVGLDVPETSLDRRTDEFSAMVAQSGRVGPDVVRALLLRQRCELWGRRIIRGVRSGRIPTPKDSPLDVVARHHDLSGRRLPAKVATVELINLLRPIVAVARFIVFEAHALERHPDSRRYAASSNDQEVEWFVQEVRRFFPFFPFIGGIARESFDWQGHTFQPGDWVFLDIYGTNRDGRTWARPDEFDSGRFRNQDPGVFRMIPQGGGDHFGMHRCAGEWLTIALMKQAARIFTRGMAYTVPAQDLSIDLGTMPAQPSSGFIMSDIRPQA